MKKSVKAVRVPLSLLILALCLTFSVHAESSESPISLPGTLWKIGFTYVQFLDTPAGEKNGEEWREAVFHYVPDGESAYLWRMEGSKIHMREKNSSDRWDDIIAEIAGETTISVSSYHLPKGESTPKVLSKYDLTRVVDPKVLQKYGMKPLPPAQVWNLKKDDFSLKKTLWKYQSDDGDKSILYLSFGDDALYYFGSYNQVDRNVWRQDGRKMSFTVLGEYDEIDYEGKFVDWMTVKGTYRFRKSQAGKPVGFKLFRVTDPVILGEYVDPYHRSRYQDKDMHAVRIDNPNPYSVLVTVRDINDPDSHWTGTAETTWSVPPKGSRAQRFPNGKYEIYFRYSNEPKALYKGDHFSISDGGVEIKLVSVTGGNYGIRRVN